MNAVRPPTEILNLKPGQAIRVVQSVVGRDKIWKSSVEGVVISSKAEPTGSWYAHGKCDKLWLVRIRLRKADGEITTLVVDQNSQITILK
jgi:hypothetical protein